MPNSRLSKFRLAAALLPLMIGSPAVAATAFDATGDILPTFVGTATPDLDVTSFSVSFNSLTNTFLLGASFAGPIDSTLPGFYVIGVDTGAGAIRPFANINEPNVVFDQVLLVQKNGSVTLGANTLSATVVGNLFTLSVPGNLFTSTGAAPGDFGFNIWPRIGLGNNNQITDFAPDNALLTANNALLTPAVPEPATWLMMILGFGIVGGAIRVGRARRQSAAPLDAFA
jgi:PEP-CTERM motif